MSGAAALDLRPLERAPDATVRVPGSKSITNRALLIAALADGESVLSGALFSDDTRYMAEALRALGAGVEADEGAARLAVAGTGGVWPAARADLWAGNAGTTMRFLTAALCLGRGRYRIDGSARMRERPIQDLLDALAQLGARVRAENGDGCPPVVVEAEGLGGGTIEIRGERSSQFVSAVLQAAPYAAADVTLGLSGELIAKPYVDMTISVMRAFGVEVDREGYERFHVAAPQEYRGRTYAIEPDASSAHYFWAAAALTGGRVRVEGLGRDSLQGDVRFAELLEAMGAEVRWEPSAVEVSGPERLSGIDVDLNALSDTAPTLAVLGAFTTGPVRLRNVAHLRWQESDRLHAVATELARLGVTVEELADGIEVRPSAVRPGLVRTYDDHRIAMSFALIGLRVAGVRIEDPGCVAKTFPDFFARLEELRR
jgi:3-phosphoshikimate 1-carboxyvinyltransferase